MNSKKVKPAYFRTLFSSFWLPYVYDFWVWVAVLGHTRSLREKVLEFIPRKARLIIDLATGTGEEAIIIKKNFPNVKVLASDLSEGMIKTAKRKILRLRSGQALNIEWSVQDAVATNYPSEIADFVLISFAIHDLPREQRFRVMQEAFRILKKKGKFAIYDYHFPKNIFFIPPLIVQFLLVENKDGWDFLRNDVAQELRKVGFKNIEKKLYYKDLAQIVVGEKVN